MIVWALAAVLTLSACAPRPQTSAETPPDTLRGRLEVVGSEPGTSAVLMLDRDTRSVTLLGDRTLLNRLAGLEVVIWGQRVPGDRFQVGRFAVRASSGVPALDGVLGRNGRSAYLVTADGRRHAIARLPQALEGLVGARVWLAGPLDRAPDSFGVIAPP